MNTHSDADYRESEAELQARYETAVRTQPKRFFLRYKFGRDAPVYTQAFDSDMARTIAIIGLPIDGRILRKWESS